MDDNGDNDDGDNNNEENGDNDGGKGSWSAYSGGHWSLSHFQYVAEKCSKDLFCLSQCRKYSK